MRTKKYFSPNNHLSENGIALYVDAIKLEQVGKLPEEILRHVEECEECAMQVMEVTELVSDDQYDNNSEHPFFGPKKQTPFVFPAIYRIAAVLVIAALISTIYYILADRTSTGTPGNEPVMTEQLNQLTVPNRTVLAETEKTSEKDAPSLFAMNFEPSPNLEDLVQTQFRSISIEVISPVNGDIVQTPVTFRWKRYEKRVTIKILSNKELTLVSSTLSGDSFTSPKKFAPGLYYWKLETTEELLFVGKFLVK